MNRQIFGQSRAKGLAEDVLAHALDHQPLGFSGLWHAGGPGPKAGERLLRKADGKLVDAVERGVQAAQGGKPIGGAARPSYVGAGTLKLRRDALVCD